MAAVPARLIQRLITDLRAGHHVVIWCACTVLLVGLQTASTSSESGRVPASVDQYLQIVDQSRYAIAYEKQSNPPIIGRTVLTVGFERPNTGIQTCWTSQALSTWVDADQSERLRCSGCKFREIRLQCVSAGGFCDIVCTAFIPEIRQHH